MNIELNRTRTTRHWSEGSLSINGQPICSTLESIHHLLPPGTYPLCLHRCKQKGHQCLCIGTPPDCKHCPKLGFVEANTAMPCVCPQLAMGNGILGRDDGSILVGESPLSGCIIHSGLTYARLLDRLRYHHRQGNSSTLTILAPSPS